MSQTYVSAALRREVRDRAQSRCEYCLYPESLAFAAFWIDHIIAEKHGGQTVSENIAYSSAVCNLHKGTDLASLDPQDGALVRLFNPRTDVRSEHFRLNGALLEPLSAVGRVTVRLLKLNAPDRIREREDLIKAGFYD